MRASKAAKPTKGSPAPASNPNKEKEKPSTSVEGVVASLQRSAKELRDAMERLTRGWCALRPEDRELRNKIHEASKQVDEEMKEFLKKRQEMEKNLQGRDIPIDISTFKNRSKEFGVTEEGGRWTVFGVEYETEEDALEAAVRASGQAEEKSTDVASVATAKNDEPATAKSVVASATSGDKSEVNSDAPATETNQSQQEAPGPEELRGEGDKARTSPRPPEETRGDGEEDDVNGDSPEKTRGEGDGDGEESEGSSDEEDEVNRDSPEKTRGEGDGDGEESEGSSDEE